jgi:hypothetical protein
MRFSLLLLNCYLSIAFSLDISDLQRWANDDTTPRIRWSIFRLFPLKPTIWTFHPNYTIIGIRSLYIWRFRFNAYSFPFNFREIGKLVAFSSTPYKISMVGTAMKIVRKLQNFIPQSNMFNSL